MTRAPGSGGAWALAAAVLAAAVALPAGGAAAANRTLTVYARATHAQFLNHADDRKRGAIKNPFNADENLPPKETKGGGPQAGDNALYQFKLYRDSSLKQSIGTAVYSCTVGFAHEAICEADFELNGGGLFASGPASFDASQFTLAVSGGTGSFAGARGQVSSAPYIKDAHRLTFVLR
jgi:hypothetical protein